MSARAHTTRRKEEILLAYIRALGGRWPWQTDLGEVLQAISAVVPGVTAAELRAAVAWSIRESKRKEAKLERAVRECVAAGGKPWVPK